MADQATSSAVVAPTDEQAREQSSVPELETHPEKARYSLRKPPEEIAALDQSSFTDKAQRKKSRAGLRDPDANLVRVDLLPSGDLGQRIEVSGYGAAPRVVEVFPAEDLDEVIEADELEQIELNIEAEANQQMLNFDLSTEYQKPSLERALQYRKLHMPTRTDGSQFPFWGTKTGRFVTKACSFVDCFREGRKSDFIPFGPGVSAYFKFLKALTTLFVFLCILSVPFLVVNVNGGSKFSNHPFPFAQTTLGNLYADFNSTEFLLSNGTQNALNQTVVNAQFVTYTLRLPAFCSGNPDGCVFKRTDLLIGYAIWDAFISVVIIFALNVMIHFTKHETYMYKQKIPKIEDYSIECTVPRNADAKALQGHFEGILQNIDSRRLQPEAHVANGGFCEIFDVQIVESTGNAISLCIKRGFLLKRLARLDAKIKVMRSRGVHESRITPSVNKYNKTRELIQKLDERAVMRAEKGQALMGFVTFESQEAKVRLLQEYDVFWACGRQPRRLRYEGKEVVRVKTAPPPSTLLWENQEISVCSRITRMIIAMIILAATLGVTAGLSFITDSNRVFNEVVEAASGQTFQLCNGQYDNLNLTLSALAQVAKQNGDTGCFCDYELLAQRPAGSEDNGFLFIPGGICSDHVLSKITSIGKEAGLSVVIFFINIIIYKVIIVTAEFMRFRNVVAREFAVLRSIFVITFINAAVICLFVNTDWNKLTGSKIVDVKFNDGTTFIQIGQFVDFEPSWYSRVGVELFLIGIMNIIGPHVLPMMRYMYHVFERKYFAPHAVSQQVLNEMYIGEEFLLSVRLAQTLMMVWYVLMFASGMPIMYWVGLTSVVLAYWFDKFYFVRLVRTPPQFDTAMQIWTLKAMEYAVILHCLIGFWMYSSPRMFPLTPDEAQASLLKDLTNSLQITATEANNITQPSVAFVNEMTTRFARPESIIMLACAAGILLFKLLKRFGRSLLQCASPAHMCMNIVRSVTGRDQRLRFVNKYVLGAEPFESALRNGHVVGVRSYNILANPFYQRVFQMQDGLADDRDRAESSASSHAATEKQDPNATYRGYQSLQDALNIRKGTAVSSIESRAIWKDDGKSSTTSNTSKVTTQLYSPPAARLSKKDEKNTNNASKASMLVADNPGHDRSSYEKDEGDVKSTKSAKTTKSVKSIKATMVEEPTTPSILAAATPEDKV